MADATLAGPAKKPAIEKQSKKKSARRNPGAKRVAAEGPASKAAKKRRGKAPAAPPRGPEVPARRVAAKVNREVRGSRAIKVAGFEEVLKKKAELAAVTSVAKRRLKEEYAEAMALADAIEAKYKDLFGEPLAAKGRRVSAKARKTGEGAPITEAEVESFIEQKERGIPVAAIKVGRRGAKVVERIAEAYDDAGAKSSSEILASLK